MQKLKWNFLWVCVAIIFAACSDSESNHITNNYNSSVLSIYHLGTCDENNAGNIVFVEKDSADYVCFNKKWVLIQDDSLHSDTLKILDTLILTKMDTLKIRDTLTLSKTDTLKIRDTLTLSKTDTLTVRDTLTLTKTDTLKIQDTIIVNVRDTIIAYGISRTIDDLEKLGSCTASNENELVFNEMNQAYYLCQNGNWTVLILEPKPDTVSTVEDLPSCNSLRTGDSVYVENQSVKYICTAGQWTLALDTLVDLGLSVKWASVNIGAALPADYGNYYSWGESAPKAKYTADNSEMNNGNGALKISGARDAATANWGAKYRMPTGAELKELANNCSFTASTRVNSQGKSVQGYNVKCKTDNTLFLPLAGYKESSLTKSVGELAYFWGSDAIYNDGLRLVYALFLSTSKHSAAASYLCINGYSVRAVSAD
ncbi:hypothetical protein [Hallerella porci]|uniref:Major paralogous domain-containing protein n=1 Tax=Hallerella porci TaxID=1945871 RepID=A0ABX5LU61_9BACT|nr:hypothetical protein [Hallerella porci]PWL03990.1 hypothetical protein B0H50_1011 [Hallerella porci]